MKKSLLLLSLFFVVVAACVKEDDETVIPSEPGVPEMDYGVRVSDTVLHYYNVIANYRDDNSRTVSEQITTTDWKKHFDGFGDSLVLKVVFTLREDVDTSYTNTEWLRVDGAVAKIDARTEFYASASKVRSDGSRSFHVGDAMNQYNRNNMGGFGLSTLHWQGLTNSLNRKGDYAHYSLK